MTTNQSTTQLVNTTTIPDEKFGTLIEAGFTVKEIEAWYAKEEYRREYNARPEVKARRAEYNQKRNARMSTLRMILKETK